MIKIKIGLVHHIARVFYFTTTLAVTIYLATLGSEYYALPLEERFYHAQHTFLKPSGFGGHGLGIVGTLMIAFGVSLYILAKKYGFLTKMVRLKYLLEFHIYLCTIGPILVLFHTAFKFGGIVSIGFWSMVIVVLSGVVGRFLYIRLPRDWQGRELTYTDAVLEAVKLRAIEGPSAEEQSRLSRLERQLKSLKRNQSYFKYWHLAHRPFALIMMFVVIIHVVATLLLGFTLSW